VIKIEEYVMGGTCSTNESMRNAYKILVGKPEGKRSLGRFRRRWEGNITMDLTEIRWEVVEWIYLAEDRNQWQAVVNMVMNIWVLQKVGNFLTS
jgi:hypothetical protein